MNDQTTFRQIAAISSIAAALLVLVATIVLSMAVDFNFEFLSNPVDLISAELDIGAAGLFRWGSILEMFGYFLLLIPATLYLWFWLRPRSTRLVTLYTVLGLSSILLGVIGAAVRAGFWPPMMIAYSNAAEAQRAMLEIVFRSVTNFTFESLYALDSILAGLWWLGIGLVLRRERRNLGIATVILGIAIHGAGLGWLLRVDPLARLELFYFLEPFWAIWLGVIIWRGEERDERTLEAATAV